MNTLVAIISLLVISCASAERVNGKAASDGPDEPGAPVVQTRITELGEEETRVSGPGGVIAMETTVPGEGENFLFVREALKHNRLVWLVYKNKQLIDCNVTTHHADLHKFKNKFHSAENNEASTSVQEGQGSTTSAEVSELMDFRGLLKSCRFYKKAIRSMRIEKHEHEKHRDQEQARRSRSKRSVFSMIYPGTNWCGRGDQAAGGYDDLGENMHTDRCCREHDHCPFTISRFTSSYNYWNYRFHTLSHCSCEERFKACLKSAGNSVANMVGYIYFNYVGTECFNLTPQETCAERSWWGKCTKYDTEYTAVVAESNITF